MGPCPQILRARTATVYRLSICCGHTYRGYDDRVIGYKRRLLGLQYRRHSGRDLPSPPLSLIPAPSILSPFSSAFFLFLVPTHQARDVGLMFPAGSRKNSKWWRWSCNAVFLRKPAHSSVANKNRPQLIVFAVSPHKLLVVGQSLP